MKTPGSGSKPERNCCEEQANDQNVCNARIDESDLSRSLRVLGRAHSGLSGESSGYPITCQSNAPPMPNSATLAKNRQKNRSFYVFYHA